VVFAADPKVGGTANSSVSLENLTDAQWQFDHDSLYDLRNMKQRSIAERLDTGLDTYLAEIGRTPLLTAEQELALATKVSSGDEAARDQMIRSNLRLVVTIAQDYLNLGLPLSDLVSEGTVGLAKAVERFDPTKGAKLSTYAAWWIKQSIKLALSNQVKTVRLPIHLLQKIAKVRRASFDMALDLGREPNDDELAEAIGMQPARVSELRNGFARPMSLDAVVGDDDSVEFGETIADEDAHTSYEWLRDRDLQVQLKSALLILDDREKTIVLERFGLNGGKPKTLEQIGRTIGVTRERIRQLQARALSKLRRALTRDINSASAGLNGGSIAMWIISFSSKEALHICGSGVAVAGLLCDNNGYVHHSLDRDSKPQAVKDFPINHQLSPIN
jgi:RNA polymerase primary sigma factor